jgi:hypothetical protein
LQPAIPVWYVDSLRTGKEDVYIPTL